MRDPDSQMRARRQHETCEAPPGLGGATSAGCASQDPEPRFASGTHAGGRVGSPDRAGDRAALDLAAIPRPSLVFDACGRIIDVNPLAETLFGYARFELVGESVDLIASKLASAEQPGRIRFLSATAGACVRHRSGRAIAVDALLCPRDEWSTAVVFRAVETTDVGLRAEDVAEIVHDLKNPLSTIALEARLLDDKLAHGYPSDTRDALARINRNIEFLDQMVRGLLDLCAFDAGRLELHRRPTELRMLLERIIDRVVPTRDRGRVSLDAAEPLTTSIDDLRIERVVANLLQNALKYGPKITGIVVGLAAMNDAIRVSVTDAGPGMTPAETGYVFDKFRRASTAGSREGSGLGLYVSRKIVEAHGGRIGVTSVQGAGSQFFFELPVT